METLGIHHLAVKLLDLEATIPFYRDVLGLPELQRHHEPDGRLRSVWLKLGQGAFLALERWEGAEPALELPALGAEAPWRLSQAPGWHLVALRIPSGAREAIEARLVAQGIQILHKSRWTLYLRDPEGNRIGLSHHPEEAG